MGRARRAAESEARFRSRLADGALRSAARRAAATPGGLSSSASSAPSAAMLDSHYAEPLSRDAPALVSR